METITRAYYGSGEAPHELGLAKYNMKLNRYGFALLALSVLSIAGFGRVSIATGGLPGDCTGNGRLTLRDYRRFPLCLSGPSGALPRPDCPCWDVDGDADVDLADLAAFNNAFETPSAESFCGHMGNCLDALESPGCANESCCRSVCEVDSFCCREKWDITCADMALRVCGAVPGVINDTCSTATSIPSGLTGFQNLLATVDAESTPTCRGVRAGADIWFCHTASCSGFLTVSLCGSVLDTVLFVYDGCECPPMPSVACSDDACGSSSLSSRVVLPVVEGMQVLVRVGGYMNLATQQASRGQGFLSLFCGSAPVTDEVCGTGRGACDIGRPTPGCDDVDCCTGLCGEDPYCCDVTWDETCADEASGICGEGFTTCGQSGAGGCLSAHATPGCASAPCCNSVCDDDAYCCVTAWDASCVNRAQSNSLCP